MKPTQILTVALVFGLSLSASLSFANECEDAMLNLTTKLTHLSQQNPNSEVAHVFHAMGRHAGDARLMQLFPKEMVFELIALEDNTVFTARLKGFFEQFEARHEGTTDEKVRHALTHILDLKVPHGQIEGRINALLQQAVTHDSLVSALGKISYSELGMLVYGGDPLHPAPESLLGRYMAETGATSVVRKFSKIPYAQGGNGAIPDPTQVGPDRLVVSLSEQSLAVYSKYFNNENFLVHLHTPGQGTLMIGHNKKTATYGGDRGEFRLPTIGSIMPHILLGTTEAQRMTQFMLMLGHADQNVRSIAQQPWRLQGYCATGAYSSCTHWFGTIPLGDSPTDAYLFPGLVDQWASNRVHNDPAIDAMPRISMLKDYSTFQGMTLEQSAQFFEQHPIIRRVWKIPGNQQLASLLGLMPENARGELANPGYVALSLTAAAKTDRVPFVFLVTADHHAPIAADFNPQISAY